MMSGNAFAAEEHSALGIQGDDLYSFATSASQKNGVVAGEIENITGSQLVIVRAESDVAGRVELHTHLMEDGVMKMREVENYTVGANGEFEMGPHGEHIMLFDLKAPLKQGDVFSVRLIGEDGASIEVPVLVRAAGDVPKDDDKDMDHGKMEHKEMKHDHGHHKHDHHEH